MVEPYRPMPAISKEEKMEYINKIEVQGTVGNVRTQEFDRGEGNPASKVAHVSIVTNFVYKGHGGEAVIETTWHNVDIWNRKSSDNDVDQIQKGQILHVIGRVRIRKFLNESGEARDIYEIVAQSWSIVDGKEQIRPTQEI